MGNVKAVIDSRFSKRQNGFQILIRVQHSRKDKEDIKLGEYLEKREYFDSAKERVKKRKGIEHERINELIIEKLQHYRERVKANGKKSTPLKSKESILAEFEHVLEMLHLDGKYNSHRMISYAYKYLTEFLKSINKTALDVYEIDDRFLDKFKAFLKGKGLKGTTIKAYVDKLRTIHNSIVERLNITKSNPFKKFTVGELKEVEEKENNRNILSEELLKKFIAYIPKSKERIFYKNIFLAQFYLQGTRVSDILTLTWAKLEIENYIPKPELDDFSSTFDIINYGLNLGKKVDYSKVKLKLNFKAFKTGQQHEIPLSIKAIIQLRYFLDRDLQLRYLEGELADDEFRTYLGKKIGYKHYLDDYKVEKLKELIIEQIERTPDSCIFHNWSIEGLKGAELKRFIQSRTTYINKSLRSNERDGYYAKRVGVHLSTHSARHLFAICYIGREKNVFALSRLLFHKKINTTQEYLKRLNVRLHNEIDAHDFYDNF